MTTTILQTQLQLLAEEHNSSSLLKNAFGYIQTEMDLIRFVHRYVVFNGYFAGGVSNLAGEFHIRQDLFRDPTETFTELSDKSSEIASHIYAAAEDEYLDRDTHQRITHRELAKVFFREVLQFYNVTPQKFSALFKQDTSLDAILWQVKDGYALNKQVSEDNLLTGLVFHLGSELLADSEFNLIDNYLKTNHTLLVDYLKSVKVEASGKDAYEWLQQHTYVEEEHFNHALVAGEKAINYYAGEKSKDDVYTLIISGFLQFAQVQKIFFEQFFQ